MIKLAIEGNPKFIIEDFEIQKSEVSYTINTLKYLNKKHPDCGFDLLIGLDTAKKLDLWKDWQQILIITQLYIIKRGIYEEEEIMKLLERLTILGKSPKVIDMPLLDISSTQIRNYIKHNKSIKYLLPSSVEDYIYKNGLYK